MTFSLAAMTRRIRNIRRPSIVIRDIAPPATMATDLFRACYLPVITAWETATDRIVAEYERTLASMTTDASLNKFPIRNVTDAPADIEAQISGVQAEIDRLLLTLTPRLRNWSWGVERWFRGKWRGAVLSATGVDLLTMLGPEDVRQTVEATIEWNASLIKDVSEQARRRIANSVFTGLRERKPAREVAKEIREATGMARRRSINIASHQLSSLSAELAEERRREAGIDTWKWRHSGKLHPRPEHVARDGKLYTDETAPEDKPGQLPFCGCRSQAVVTFD